MSKCPKCGEEIDYLVFAVDSPHIFSFRLVNGATRYKEQDYEDLNNLLAGSNYHYECPKCRETLFSEEEAAISLLKGGQATASVHG